jgi:polysaccharide biosynthesis protein PslH
MKILQLANKPPFPDKDGGTIATLNLTKGFARLGHQVTVLAMKTSKHPADTEKFPVHLREMADFRLIDVPATVSKASALQNLIFSGLPYTAVRFISPAFEKALARLLREKDFDIIQLEGLYLCPYIPLIRKYSGAKIAYRAHNVEHEIWERSVILSSGPQKWYYRNLAQRIYTFEKAWLNQYDLLIPITERDGARYREMGNTMPVHVSPAGIDQILPVSCPTNEGLPSLFHIGSLDWAPNQEGLIWFLDNCWSVLRHKHPGLRLYIAGRNAPQWLIRKLGLPGIEYCGEVPDARTFMYSKSVMIVPLFSGSGMRVKIIEGMALGKAIISTSTGAEGLGVEHDRNILIADTAGDFIRELEALLTSREKFQAIGEEAAVYIREKFDNLAIAGDLSGFYQKHLA